MRRSRRSQILRVGQEFAEPRSTSANQMLKPGDRRTSVASCSRSFKGLAIDPDNPPVFESQAAYLERHKLLPDAEREALPVMPLTRCVMSSINGAGAKHLAASA